MKTKASIGSITVGSIATLALAFSPIQAAQAAIITSLYNTGVDGSGNVLANGTVGDSHYSLISPTGVTATRILTSANGFPITPWVGDNTTSRWIAPNTNSEVTALPGIYTYSTTFDLTGFDVSTAKIEGLWSVDNIGAGILLNGKALGIVNNGGFEFFTPFTISSGFQNGINTLEFLVSNWNNSTGQNTSTGLRTELIGTADLAATAVPEPSDIMGTAIAFGSVVLLKRKLTKKTLD